MAIKKLNPYLNFDGTAEKAIALYESALGAKTDRIMRWGDVAEMKVEPQHKNRVMHASLFIGEGVIMVSDCQPGQAFTTGDSVHVSVDFDDPADMTKRFNALAAGGKVLMPVQDMFWGAKFGMLKDAYGISWMFNCDNKKN
jgi:PhnB protein